MSTWDEETVQEVLGSGFTFFEASADGSACSFTAIPASMTLAFRTGVQGELDLSRSGAALTGDVADVDACDGGFVVDVQGAITIVEVLDEASGQIFQATASGVEMSLAASLELLTQACAAPTDG